MGDRVDCTLILKDPPTQELRELIAEVEGIDEDDLVAERWINFEQMNYGEMDASLFTFLTEQKIPFIWFYNAGYDFSSGIKVFNPEIEETAVDYMSHDPSTIMLSIDDAIDPEKFAAAKRWQEWVTSVVTSRDPER